VIVVEEDLEVVVAVVVILEKHKEGKKVKEG